MTSINNTEVVKKQYGTSNNLNTRISIHSKYSKNKQGFHNWIISHYEIKDGFKILELGCGTGDMWVGQEEMIGKAERIILSDFSEGMLTQAKEKIGDYKNIEYQVIDIQNIPYEDGEFDVVIGNMMLYHVPDLDKGLAEVRRVLKDGGKFYCATFGVNGIMNYVNKALEAYVKGAEVNENFTLQNGEGKLGKHFGSVEKCVYDDALLVTDVDDMVDYIYSLSGMSGLQNIPRETIKEELTKRMVDGVLTVPKEYGMFIAR